MHLDSIAETEPYAINETLSTDDPTNVEQFLGEHGSELQGNIKRMYGDESKTDVLWYGPGTIDIFNGDHETFLWQWRSNGKITFGQETKEFPVNNCILVPKNVRMSLVNGNPDCVTLSISMPLPNQ